MLAKISKIARFFLLVLLFTIGFLYIVFRSQPVQTWLANIATDYLSQQLGTKVRVGAVDVEFFKTAVLEDIYIEDQHQDTLFYFRKLKVDYNTYDKNKKIIQLNYVGIEGAKILFGEHKGDSVNNYDFFIDFFDGGPRDPSKPKVVWTMKSKVVEIERTRFDYFVGNDPKPDFMDFNYNDMSFQSIDARLSDFNLVDDSLYFFTEHLETTEKCGFRLDHLQARTKIHEGGIEFDSLSLITPHSDIKDQFSMTTLDWKDYNDFNNKVKLKAHLKKSRVSTTDLAYFSNNLKLYKTVIEMTGSGEGFLSRLKGKDTELKVFDQTRFTGDWTMTGLPDFDNTILDFEVDQFETNYKDLYEISLGNMPDNFRSLGKIKYSGMFSGFYDDFITYGTISTDIGDFESDINIKYKEGLEKATYSGSLKTAFFKLRNFMPEAKIDDIAFNLHLKGTGLARNTYNVEVDGDINQLSFLNYTYKNITAKGIVSQESFQGSAQVRDENLDMDFDGEFLSNTSVPVASFKAVVRHSNLATFGFDTTAQDVSGTFLLDFVGKDLDNASGSIYGEQIKIKRNGAVVEIPDLMLRAVETSAGKQLSLTSKVIDASINGQFTLKLIDISFLHLLHQLIPAYFEKPERDLPNEDFVFNFDLKDPFAITSLYQPELSLEPCTGEGFYRSADQSLKFDFRNDRIAYNQLEFNGISLTAHKNYNSDLKIDVLVNNITDDRYIHSENIELYSRVYGNKIAFDVKGIDTGYKVGMDARGEVVFVKDSILLQMTDLALNVNKDVWNLDTNAFCLMTGNFLYIEHFLFRNEKQSIALNGEFGDNTSNRMDFAVGDFALRTINYFTKAGSIPKLGGLSNGKITYRVNNGVGKYTSDLRISDFTVGKDTIGDLSVHTGNQSLGSKQHLRVFIEKGLLDSMTIEGDVDFASKNNNLNLYAKLPPSEIRVFEPFLEGVFKNMKGSIFTEDSLHISGSFSNPVLDGDILVKNAEVLVDYLNVPIRFSARLQSEKNRMTILPFVFYDARGHSGKAKGYLFHKSFDDFVFNLNLWDLDKFLVLNTTKQSNELYYGTAYASGDASFNGPFDKLDIKINAKTEAGTKFYLPISEGDASGLPSYVHFKTAKKKIQRQEDEFPINSLVMDVEATNDAKVEIIFDETLGDKISGTGSGNLRMEMNKSADFYMFGTYKVQAGEYLFTAFDLYNKPFGIKPGGTITWYGDPLDAKLDIAAVYSVNANPNPLLSAVSIASTSTQSTPNQLITAESELFLKGNLFSPEVTFGLNFPKLQQEAGNSSSSLSSIISRIKSDKEEVSRQVFSLLLMRQFLPPTFAQGNTGLNNAGSTALSSAGSDLLSSQLSNWLNKIDPNWKVNVIYKNGSITLPPEYGLMLSSKFFNDKLSFDGSVSSYSTMPNINLEYKITKKGNVKVKAYTRSSFNQVNTTSLSTPITTNGVGIVYTKDFNVIKLFKRKKKKKS